MKTITISDDVYEKLKLIKGDKTFSEVIDDLIKENLKKRVEIFLKILEMTEPTKEELKIFVEEVKKFEDSFRNFFPNRTEKKK